MTRPGANEDEHPHDPPHRMSSTPVYAASTPACPASHVQSVNALLPAAEVEDGGQAAQVAEPTADLCVPVSHATHGPPSGPVYPAGHSPVGGAHGETSAPSAGGQSSSPAAISMHAASTNSASAPPRMLAAARMCAPPPSACHRSLIGTFPVIFDVKEVFESHIPGDFLSEQRCFGSRLHLVRRFETDDLVSSNRLRALNGRVSCDNPV